MVQVADSARPRFFGLVPSRSPFVGIALALVWLGAIGSDVARAQSEVDAARPTIDGFLSRFEGERANGPIFTRPDATSWIPHGSLAERDEGDRFAEDAAASPAPVSAEASIAPPPVEHVLSVAIDLPPPAPPPDIAQFARAPASDSAGDATPAPSAPRKDMKDPVATGSIANGKPLKGGVAVWYQHGTRTANGERYDPDGLTAGHRTVPFGKRVRVVNKRNGRSVVVRINDRGPVQTKFVIDLSRGSAKALGFSGTAEVALYEID